jgi:hypothetical protein
LKDVGIGDDLISRNNLLEVFDDGFAGEWHESGSFSSVLV